MFYVELGTEKILEIKENQVRHEQSESGQKVATWCVMAQKTFPSSSLLKNVLRKKNANMFMFLLHCALAQCPANSANFGVSPLGSEVMSGEIVAEVRGQYPNNMDCTWRVGAPNRNISLIIEYINVEYAANCQYDSLTIMEADGFYDERFCDYNDSYVYLDLNGEVNIAFESDGSQGTQETSEPAGFLISFEIEDPCNPNPCENGGLCNDGTCSCSDRYRGDWCEIERDFCELFTCINGEVLFVEINILKNI